MNINSEGIGSIQPRVAAKPLPWVCDTTNESTLKGLDPMRRIDATLSGLVRFWTR